jgi:hypothetical protein
VGKDYPEISFLEEILAGSSKLKGVDNLAVEPDRCKLEGEVQQEL